MASNTGRRHLFRISGLLALAFVALPAPAVDAGRMPSGCAGDRSSQSLSAMFTSAGSGLVGGDYAHAYPLGSDRTLWLLQDSFIGAAAARSLHAASFRHNAALLQEGLCFSAVGTGSFLGGAAERPLRHWFWPLDGEIGADHNLHVFAAEFTNANGTGAADGATPVAVWQAVIRPADLAILRFTPARDHEAKPLYGFSIASDRQWTYLYGNCYRQFTNPGFVGAADATCNTDVSVARVPRGQFDAPPAYWNGSSWVADRERAVSVAHAGWFAHPLQVEPTGDGRFVGVSKVDDWWGSSVSLFVAARATGPFAAYATVEVAPRCTTGCNTYFAAFTPWRAAGARQVVLSSFTWDFAQADSHPDLYRPFVVDVPDVPPRSVPSRAAR